EILRRRELRRRGRISSIHRHYGKLFSSGAFILSERRGIGVLAAEDVLTRSWSRPTEP
ncbi:unnamed protein product, partial [Ascophyllum nodosum]